MSKLKSFIPLKLLFAIAEFFILAIFAILPAITIYIDIVILDNGVGEISITEISQETFLFISAMIFWYGAYKKPTMRGFLVLVAGFFTAMFIREMDAFLDEISHGFWFYLALPFSLFVIFYAYYFAKGTTLKHLLEFINTKPFFLLLCGLIILLILSRTFGSGGLLWDNLLPHEYSSLTKTAIQEALELFGYSFILYGSVVFYYRGFVSYITKAS